MSIQIVQLQLPVYADLLHTYQHVRQAATQAAAQGADLIALPEMFCCPYEVQNFPLYAEKSEGPTFQFAASLARELGVYLSAGSLPEKDDEGHIYNTAYVFDRSGQCIAKHRKMHLFDIDVAGGQSFQESQTLTAGHQITTFDTEFGRLGLCICYDLRFPELVRLMALAGAQLILVPAAFNMTTGPLHWDLTFRSQAVYNQVFIVGTAPARDLNASYHSWGHSIVTDPWGHIIAELDEKEGSQLTTLDLNMVTAVRQQLPLLAHRRTDVYRLIPGDS